ncbi:hypothetical protein THAOC_09742 [Thalassiosira oceanica]|uniref:Uncharacterized protein n=1 Tax=Thalassiosira oceanica TaxID=159749 RepID=K0SRT6_THAOC|nr:hypothetical protein THAOC_09742 [Thalassiosira oceanica]|eukprot:EJK69038.1 hypothetical protein THAOC_09742 [Thalassiosira oceanica]
MLSVTALNVTIAKYCTTISVLYVHAAATRVPTSPTEGHFRFACRVSKSKAVVSHKRLRRLRPRLRVGVVWTESRERSECAFVSSRIDPKAKVFGGTEASHCRAKAYDIVRDSTAREVPGCRVSLGNQGGPEDSLLCIGKAPGRNTGITGRWVDLSSSRPRLASAKPPENVHSAALLRGEPRRAQGRVRLGPELPVRALSEGHVLLSVPGLRRGRPAGVHGGRGDADVRADDGDLAAHDGRAVPVHGHVRPDGGLR